MNEILQSEKRDHLMLSNTNCEIKSACIIQL